MTQWMAPPLNVEKMAILSSIDKENLEDSPQELVDWFKIKITVDIDVYDNTPLAYLDYCMQVIWTKTPLH